MLSLDSPSPSAPVGESKQQRSSQTQLLLGTVVLGFSIFWVYWDSLAGPFIFDDTSTIIENVSLRQLWPLLGDSENPAPLSPPAATAVSARPLVNLSLAVNYYFGGLHPTGYRVVNVLLHCFSALLIRSIVARTLHLDYFHGKFRATADGLALATALLWAMHPVVTECVVYVTQRTELMMGSSASASRTRVFR